ncbi:MAG: hypothetical protein N3A62_10160 [Thermodesulfovibrionales bacterium]|nr:hypothetical protein [Thermodesulfovibrionales bacterium]
MKVKNHKEGIRRLEEFVTSIRYGEPQAYKNLIIFPLYTDIVVAAESRYMLLDEAMKTGKFHIREVSEGGSVPELHVINELDIEVLLLEGEILKGAKQDRTVNSTIIVGKGKDINMSVSCVEAGRWRYESREFERSDFIAEPGLRKEKTRSVSENMMCFIFDRSDQGGVWDYIADKQARMNLYTQTSCLSELYESRRSQQEEYEKRYTCDETQTGIAVFINGILSGCDIFGVKGLMQKVFKKILSGYILEGIDRSFEGEKEGEADYNVLRNKLDTFFKDIATMPKFVYKSRGEGYDIRFDKEDITGFALEHEGNIVQLAGFYFDDSEGQGYSSSSSRAESIRDETYYRNRRRRNIRRRQQ